jgi:hypothetical protein
MGARVLTDAREANGKSRYQTDGADQSWGRIMP